MPFHKLLENLHNIHRDKTTKQQYTQMTQA